jgi:predicted nucleic-acid-binding protein
MTGVDTNVLVRFFTEDDPGQASRAEVFLQSLTLETPGFVSLVSLAELVWVLRLRYGWSKPQLIQCLDRMLDSPEFVLEGQTAVAKALHHFARSEADFTDCLIERLGYAAGCAETVTFDTDACKFAGMRLL